MSVGGEGETSALATFILANMEDILREWQKFAARNDVYSTAPSCTRCVKILLEHDRGGVFFDRDTS